jgi:glycogen operon protein
VKGTTVLHPAVEPRLRGTYAGLASEPVIEHLTALGATAVELLPVHHRITERVLHERGLSNYWGYNSVAYFAPDSRYASGGDGAQVQEFKSMVKKLHSAGIEVILDVVYNHTGEGDHLGPTVSLRGIDNVAYYRLESGDPRLYADFTGCGNSLNMVHPRAIQLIMDSLRYWIQEMHVDGFRFDLASTLARELVEVDRLGAFFDIIHQDPVISQVKLIAEPWDLGPGGYQVGNFPLRWAEWNGEYRDTVRRFWRGDDGVVPRLASRLAGSSDIYEKSGRSPYASVNFVTAHDGFTLHDLVTYAQKHNQANGDANSDGVADDFSSNSGVEGETDDPAIRERRETLKRSLMATLAFSFGVPMISHGDELGRTQKGNNNAYSQDNETTWLNWDLDERQVDLLRFCRRVFELRKSNPVWRRRSFFRGATLISGRRDITWLTPDGREMAEADWHDPACKALGMLVDGAATDEVDERGRPMTGDSVLFLLNASDAGVRFAIPPAAGGSKWLMVVSSSPGDVDQPMTGGDFLLAPRVCALLQEVPGSVQRP